MRGFGRPRVDSLAASRVIVVSHCPAELRVNTLALSMEQTSPRRFPAMLKATLAIRSISLSGDHAKPSRTCGHRDRGQKAQGSRSVDWVWVCEFVSERRGKPCMTTISFDWSTHMCKHAHIRGLCYTHTYTCTHYRASQTACSTQVLCALPPCPLVTHRCISCCCTRRARQSWHQW